MGMWEQASKVAAATPAERNRYVDFLRAASILFVISGHWLITSGYYDSELGVMQFLLALEVIPWTQWLTWIFQVMPIFFIVGGYSNGVSLESARSKNLDYAQWLAGRLHRLLTPLLLLVLAWGFIAFGLALGGLAPETISFLSKGALVPTWFLAIYTMIVLLAPAAYRLWTRFGLPSLFALLALAVLTDLAFFALGWTWAGWTNYFWVWLAMHHLGFAWRDGRLGSPVMLLGLAAASFAVLVCLIHFGPYPVAMAGSPGEAVSNTLPPKITLIALGMSQFGLLLAFEKPMQRWLASQRVWTCTVIISTMIMTIYLWHMTVLFLVLATSYLLGGIGAHSYPGSAEWWWMRALWIAVPAVVLLGVAPLLAPLERLSRPADAPVPPAWRLLCGAMMAGGGLVMATLRGFDGQLLSLGSSGALLLIVGGALLCGIPLRWPATARA